MKYLVWILLLATKGFAGTFGGGNGGDVVRDYFMNRGHNMVDFLDQHPLGKEFITEYKINPQAMRLILETQKIKVVNGPIKDNTDSLVDAQGTPGLIVLDRAEWKSYIIGGVDLDRVIFHEMLRASAYNDDEYVISRPFVKLFHKYVLATTSQVQQDYTFILEDIEQNLRKPKTTIKLDKETGVYEVIGDPKEENYYFCIKKLTDLGSRIESARFECDKNLNFEVLACTENLKRAGSRIESAIYECERKYNYSYNYNLQGKIQFNPKDLEGYVPEFSLAESRYWVVKIVLIDSRGNRMNVYEIKKDFGGNSIAIDFSTNFQSSDKFERFSKEGRFKVLLEEVNIDGFFDWRNSFGIYAGELKNSSYADDVLQLSFEFNKN